MSDTTKPIRSGGIHPLEVQHQRLLPVLEDFYAFMGFKPVPGELEAMAVRLVDVINRGEDGKSYGDRVFLRWFARELEAKADAKRKRRASTKICSE